MRNRLKFCRTTGGKRSRLRRRENRALDLKLTAELRDGSKVVATGSRNVVGTETQDILLSNLGPIQLWDTKTPKLYDVRVTITNGNAVIDHFETRIGFREAKFTPEGFYLNGKPMKLRGLNRHQTYPYVGQAMPERGQRRDAWIIKNELKCNIVRTSHYPQSTAFSRRLRRVRAALF